MPEGPGDLCLRWCMILLSSLVVMGGKEGSTFSMLEWGGRWRESELYIGCDVVCDEFNVLLVKSSSF